jgi:hypothetical protein
LGITYPLKEMIKAERWMKQDEDDEEEEEGEDSSEAARDIQLLPNLQLPQSIS